MRLRHIFVGVIALGACVSDAEREDGEHDDVAVGKGDGSVSERDQLLAVRVANALTREQLDDDVGLSSRAAANIVAVRPFATFAELDAVPYVGPVAIADMVAYAEAQGWDTALAALTPAVQDRDDQFGKTLAASGNILVVGAPGEDSRTGTSASDNSATDAGAVYIYERGANGWSASQMLKGPVNVRDFGRAVAVDGDTLAVADRIGDVHVYRRDGAAWNGEAVLRGSTAGQSFGSTTLALDGDTLVVGAPGPGLAYVFTRTDSTWSQYARFEDPRYEAPYSAYGSSVAVDGGHIVVGEPQTGAGGSVHIYQVVNNWWARTELQGADANVAFGASVALRGGTLVVGEPGTDGPREDEGNIGSVVVYTHGATGWTLQARLFAATPVELSGFGRDVSLDGDVLAIGANDTHGEYGNADYRPQAGAVYLFARSGATFHQVERRISPNPQANAQFGSCVAVTADTLVVSAPRESEQRGTVYVD